MPGEVKGTLFQENRMGNHKLAHDEQIRKFYFLVTLKLKSALCVYGESPKQRKKPEKLTNNFGTRP
jgi:hypothetical protein